MLRGGLNGPDAVVFPQADLGLGDVLVEVVVALAPVLKGVDGLLYDRASNIGARDGLMAIGFALAESR